jgi:hypothetical protein
MQQLILVFLFVYFSGVSFSQQNRSVQFVPVFKGQKVELSKKYASEGNWFQFESLRFYISAVSISGEKSTWKDSQSVHLIDLEDSSSLFISHEAKNGNRLNFNIGLDSATNVSGTLDGDLDPIKGMYWAWNTGYINFKLEGFSSESILPDKHFEFHLGGYLFPNATLQAVEFSLENWQDSLVVELELGKLIPNLPWQSSPSILIPGKEAVKISKLLPTLFQFPSDEK